MSTSSMSNNQFKTGFDMSVIDEEGSNQFDFSDLSKSNPEQQVSFQQSKLMSTPPTPSPPKCADQEKPEEEIRGVGRKLLDKNMEETMMETTTHQHIHSMHTPVRTPLAGGGDCASANASLQSFGIDEVSVISEKAYKLCFYSPSQLDTPAKPAPEELGQVEGDEKKEEEPLEVQDENADCEEPLGSGGGGGVADDMDMDDGWMERCKQAEEEREAGERRREQAERERDQALAQLADERKKVDILERKLETAEVEMDSFDDLEVKMIMENFRLKKELLKLKLRFGLTTMEEACKELACCPDHLIDDEA